MKFSRAPNRIVRMYSDVVLCLTSSHTLVFPFGLPISAPTPRSSWLYDLRQAVRNVSCPSFFLLSLTRLRRVLIVSIRSARGGTIHACCCNVSWDSSCGAGDQRRCFARLIYIHRASSYTPSLLFGISARRQLHLYRENYRHTASSGTLLQGCKVGWYPLDQ